MKELLRFIATTGVAIAFALSYAKWHAFWLALVHGVFCGWTYVLYYLLTYGVPHIPAGK